LSPSPGRALRNAARVPTFLSLLGTNLVLVAVLVCMNLMLDDWKRAHGAMLTDAAVAALLLAFTLRLALTQYAQQQEIVQRKAAQDTSRSPTRRSAACLRRRASRPAPSRKSAN
jgi:hypothetical protein